MISVCQFEIIDAVHCVQVLEITEAMFSDVPGRHYTNCGFTIVVIPPSTEKREFNLLAEVSGRGFGYEGAGHSSSQFMYSCFLELCNTISSVTCQFNGLYPFLWNLVV